MQRLPEKPTGYKAGIFFESVLEDGASNMSAVEPKVTIDWL